MKSEMKSVSFAADAVSDVRSPFWLWNVTTLEFLAVALAEVFLEKSAAGAAVVETAVATVTGAST